MRQIILLTVTFLLFGICSSAQTTADKKKIYETIIESFIVKDLPIANETLSRIHRYDIDGDFNKWFYKRSGKISADTSQISVSSICVLPIRYSQPIVSYLYSKAITVDTNSLLSQADNATIDSLAKYVSTNKLVSWKRAPLANSAIGNLFKKKRVIGLSSVLLDEKNNIALVKMQVYSKNKLQSENPSRLFILNKIGDDWTIINILEEKAAANSEVLRQRGGDE